MISSINKPDYYIVSLLYIFIYTFIYNSALIAYYRFIVLITLTFKAKGPECETWLYVREPVGHNKHAVQSLGAWL